MWSARLAEARTYRRMGVLCKRSKLTNRGGRRVQKAVTTSSLRLSWSIKRSCSPAVQHQRVGIAQAAVELDHDSRALPLLGVGQLRVAHQHIDAVAGLLQRLLQQLVVPAGDDGPKAGAGDGLVQRAGLEPGGRCTVCRTKLRTP